MVLHRVTLDFSIKNVTGLELGVANTKKKSVTTMCQKHIKLNQYPEMYSIISGIGEIQEDEGLLWCRT